MTGNPNSRMRRPLTWLLPLLLIALAALVLPSVANAQGTTPTVSSVSITSTPGADNTYATGDTITVTVTFSEAVTVTGTPHVVVDIGGQPRNFKYSGDGTSAAAQPFSYTVLVGDRDADGVSLQVNSLTLNGGTIQATDDSTNATLTHAAMTFANHKLETQVVLLSNLGQPDASDTITISATESPEATITLVASQSFDINAITLDVTTPSDTLDVTVKLVDIANQAYLNYTYTGSVTTAGLQTFTLSEPSEMKFGNVGIPPGRAGGGPGVTVSYQMEVHGSGDGSVELAGTTSTASDTGAVSGISFNPRDVLIPQMRLSGHEGMIPNLIYGDVVSSPLNGSAYAAGDRIDLLFVFSQNVDIPDGHVVPIWLGDGAEHRREARFVTGLYIDFAYLFFSYTVQAADTDTNGIYIGADPLGDNSGIDFLASYGSAIPADVRLAANQLPASQSVDGSSPGTCQLILCSTVRAEVSADDRFPGFSYFIRESNFPFLILGESSAWSFEYGGELDAVVEVVLDTDDGLLDFQFFNGLSSSAYSRLALSVDGKVFLLSEANSIGSNGQYFGWLDPGLTWAENDEIAVKLIETATATFDAASYAKAEGDTFDVTVTLGDPFANTLTLPIVVVGNGGADATDYTGIPENLVFAPGDTEKTFTVTIEDDAIDDDDESITLSFGADPHIKSGGANETATITDNDDPQVTVMFGADSYTVPEGGTQSVTVTLSADPERTVVIPLTTMNQGGAGSTDYSVPTSVTFNSGEMLKTITFSATQDTEDDDDESVLLGFGANLPSRVTQGVTNEATVSITDDDDPQVSVMFGADSYTVPEGGTQSVTVTLSADPERTVVIPLTTMNQGGAGSTDYSVPTSVTFNSGDTEQTITFTTTAQDEPADSDYSGRRRRSPTTTRDGDVLLGNP